MILVMMIMNFTLLILKNEEINLHIIGVIDKYFVDNALYNSKIKRVLVIL